MSKKQIVLWSVLTGLAVTLVLVALLVPVVQLIIPDDEYSAQLSLLEYLKVAPFWNVALPAANTIYFSADGPTWLATGGLLFNILLLFGGFALLCACVFELAGMKMKNSAVKNNVLAKKLAYFVGWFAIAIGIFQIASYTVTTLMANGYMIFLFDFGCIALIVLGIAILAIARQTNKREPEQQPHKLKNALGFGIAGVFALLVFGSLFVPIFADYFLSPEYVSIYGSSSAATLLSGDPYILNTMGDYPFGFCTWVCYLMALPCLFVFVYSLIGFIFTLQGKSTNWLSARVKRWSMAALVLQTIVFMFVLCQIAVLWSSIVIEYEYCMLRWTAIVVALLPFVPYVASTLISVSKKQKAEIGEAEVPPVEESPSTEQKPKKTRKTKKPAKAKEDENGWLEENQVPNDVTAPLEKDVTKNLVDEPRPTQTDNE